MRQRDKNIIRSLELFRCMSRDQIARIFFGELKNPITNANYALKRLRDRGYIKANVNRQPYVYFPSNSTMKKDSQKIDHFLGIVDIYIAFTKAGNLTDFQVEPKYSRESMEPDAFFLFRSYPFFLEFQNSIYSDKVMKAKFQRYKDYYDSKEWHKGEWQQGNGEVIFPFILIIGNKQYKIEAEDFQVFQFKSADEFVKSIS
ncbi:hypothetical protein GN156_03880 [bacterium LRH843]|nr:hypothetical protein [bacterium LRH843]